MDIVSVLCIFGGLYFVDLVSQKIYQNWGTQDIVPKNARWFMIHAAANAAVCCVGWEDMLFCIQNSDICANEPPTYRTLFTISIAIVTHLYHMVFFFRHLSHQDWLHHGLMVGITGPLVAIFPNRAITVGLWFLTGFPGFLDYSLLWGVKMNLIESLTEKWLYMWIGAFIRSPGCIYACYLGSRTLFRSPTMLEFLIASINMILTFWNGQYYLLLSCKDYGRKLERLKNY